MAKDQPVIRIEGLSTRYGDFVVHDNLSMDVQRGEIIALVGGSGSGKTTLLRQVLGLEKPSAGKVEVFGVDVNHTDAATMQQLAQPLGHAVPARRAVFRTVRLRQRRPAHARTAGAA